MADKTNREMKSFDRVSSSNVLLIKFIVSLLIFRAAQFNQTKLISLLVEREPKWTYMMARDGRHS